MKRDTVVTKLRKLAENADVSNVDFLAVQVNLTDQDPGVFYVEVKDHKINIEPYDYHDRNCAISIKSDDFNKLISGKLDPVAAFTIGKLKVDGDVGKALEFSKLLKWSGSKQNADDIPIWLDVSMKRFEYVHPAGGNEFTSVKVTPSELEAVTGAEGWCDVCKGWEEDE